MLAQTSNEEQDNYSARPVVSSCLEHSPATNEGVYHVSYNPDNELHFLGKESTFNTFCRFSLSVRKLRPSRSSQKSVPSAEWFVPVAAVWTKEPFSTSMVSVAPMSRVESVTLRSPLNALSLKANKQNDRTTFLCSKARYRRQCKTKQDLGLSLSKLHFRFVLNKYFFTHIFLSSVYFIVIVFAF